MENVIPSRHWQIEVQFIQGFQAAGTGTKSKPELVSAFLTQEHE